MLFLPFRPEFFCFSYTFFFRFSLLFQQFSLLNYSLLFFFLFTFSSCMATDSSLFWVTSSSCLSCLMGVELQVVLSTLPGSSISSISLCGAGSKNLNLRLMFQSLLSILLLLWEQFWKIRRTLKEQQNNVVNNCSYCFRLFYYLYFLSPKYDFKYQTNQSFLQWSSSNN